MTEHNKNCPSCDRAPELREDTTRYRRGERVVPVRTHYWQCGGGCEDPDGDGPLQFVDAQLARANDEAARHAWRERFGEEMPSRGRPGRKTAAPRRQRVPVLMSEEEVQYLDRARGGMSRGAFLRHAMKAAVKAGGDPTSR